MLTQIWNFLWPGSFVTPSFPETYAIYLVAYICIFSRSLQWRSFAQYPIRWVLFGCFLAGTTVINGPVLYDIMDNQIVRQSYFPLFVQITIIILGLYALTTSSLLTILVTVAIGYAAEHISAVLGQIAVIYVYRDSYTSSFALSPLKRLFIFVIYAVLGILMWYFVGRKTYVSDEAIHNRKAWVGASILILCFVIFSSQMAWIVINLYSDGGTDKGVQLSITLFMYEALCTAMALIILLISSSRDRLIHEVEVMRDITYRQQKHYEISQEYRDIINMKMHDMKKFLNYDESHDSSWKNSPATHQQIVETITAYDSIYHTGNQAIDAIINEKSLYCARRNINLQCIVDGSVLSFMEDADIYSLVGNIADNAIDAVESIQGGEQSRTISFSIYEDAGMVILRETNYYEGTLSLKDGLPQSKRNNQYEHGFGLRSVRYIVRKYHGRMSIKVDNQLFDMTVLIPIPLTES
ncbi:ATP-binding protein [Alloscardovia theropitheci]|uniref:ATP-binding protein n=1 Tax=Alloscardovia theropitheci TaxID=2496842 RepID=A0A4R0QPA0_9BIFI|nr:sensor histidine kinase [Alloscardovia theropitheci]TCD54043.1 ATP-binding protein [Alloscardovia theropitheci]